MKMSKYANIRILRETLRKLRIVAALQNKSMLQALDDLVSQELKRLQQREDRNARPQDI